MLFSDDPPRDYWPVFKGESFDIWTPDTGTYYAWAKPEKVAEYLQTKRLRGAKLRNSPFYEFDKAWIVNRETLPCFSARIAFRDVTNRTNRRTVIAALLPPNVFITNKGPYFLWPRGDEKDQAYLLAILCSIPYDWYMRRFVETSLNYHILNPSPIPRPARDDSLCQHAVEVSGRLASVDERFSQWAQAVGVQVGSVKVAERDDLIAELDAISAGLYGLTEAQLVHIFETFHEGWDYGPRLKRVLDYSHHRE
jgi:hypothetical protein